MIIVLKIFSEHFSVQGQILAARAFDGFQIAIEDIHSETYPLGIEQYIRDPVKKACVFDAIHTMPPDREKAKWAVH